MKHQTLLILATTNTGKTNEIRSVLDGFPVQIKNLNDFGPIPPVMEDGSNFDENAYKKASHTAKVLGYAALADDSGLEVASLGGRPGVNSARYAGKGASDTQRCAKLLQEMEGESMREAAFECVLSLAVPTGQALTYTGRCEGLITKTPKGQNGFGYDPIFYYPPLKKTFAELSREEKNRVSHRGKALMELKSEFDKVLVWIEQNMPILEKWICHGGQDDR